MSQALRQVADALARTPGAVRRRFFPRFDPRRSRFACLNQRWVTDASHLSQVDDVSGHPIRLDAHDSIRISLARVVEPLITRLFEPELGPRQTVLGIGANIGYFPLVLARAVGLDRCGAVSIDDYFGSEIPTIQGAEPHAVDGMTGLLEKNRRLLFVNEFWPFARQRAGSSPRAYLEKLLVLGFAPSLVDDEQGRVVPTTLAELLQRFTPDNGDSADLVWRRG